MNLHTNSTDFMTLITFAARRFNIIPEKDIIQSPLVADFSTLWNFLRDVYQSELSNLAFVPVPDEKEIADTFIKIVKRLFFQS